MMMACWRLFGFGAGGGGGGGGGSESAVAAGLGRLHVVVNDTWRHSIQSGNFLCTQFPVWIWTRRQLVTQYCM